MKYATSVMPDLILHPGFFWIALKSFTSCPPSAGMTTTEVLPG
jgi:hypothetical protein